VGQIEMLVYDEPVVCDADVGSCTTAGGETAAPISSRTEAFISSRASRYAPGLYLYFDLPRPGGRFALVELDFPTSAGVSNGPRLTYREYEDSRLVFRSSRATGRIEAPAAGSAAGCGCQDGRLELVFTDAGFDGALDTADDDVRRLSHARFGRGEGGAFCRAAKLLPVTRQPGELEVVALSDCPVSYTGNSSGSNGGGGGDSYEASGGCYVEDDEYHEDDSGCGGDDGYDDGYDSDGGCEGDTSGGDDYYTDDGCGGDTGGDSYDSYDGGCEGDTSGSSASCEGDAYASVRRKRRRSQRDRALGMLLPFVALGLVHGWSRRRARRSRRHR
jgi:hypothetical protein